MFQLNFNQVVNLKTIDSVNLYYFIFLLLDVFRWIVKIFGLSVILLIISTRAWSENIKVNSLDNNSIMLSVQDKLLTVNIRNQPLRRVLKELTRKVRLIAYLPNSAAERKVSLSFKKIPVEQGILRILGRNSYVIKITSRPFESYKVGWIRILDNKTTQENLTVNKIEQTIHSAKLKRDSKTIQERSFTESIDEALTAPESEVRATVLESLTADDGEQAELRQTLLIALEDEDRQVRSIALNRLSEMINPPPHSILADIVLLDIDTNIRREALIQLVENYQDTATPVVQQALKDPDVSVRELAQGILSKE